MHQVYERVVGEGGCSPEYFMNRMTLAETNSYLSGQDRRTRQSWEQTRLLGGLIHKVLTGEHWDISFPWDKETEADVTTPEDLERLRALARQVEAAANGRG